MATALISFLSGCESAEEKQLRLERAHEIKMAKIASGQDALEDEREHERRMAYIQRPVMPVAPGSYVDYRGNLDYGHWGLLGWVWHDRDSSYAIQSRRYVDYQISTGYYDDDYLDRPYTRSRFDSTHKNGWQKTNITVNNYTSTSGKTLTKAQYSSNLKKAEVKNTKWKKEKKAQSTYAKGGFNNKFAKNKKDADAKKNQSKFAKKPETKSNLGKSNAAKSVDKKKQADLKAKLKAKQKAKKDAAAKAAKAKRDKIARDKAAAKARAKRAKQKAKQQKKQQKKKY